MFERKFYGLVLGISILAVIGLAVIVKDGPVDEPQGVSVNGNVGVEVPETSFSWGEIQMDSGSVEKVFEITNQGSDPLELSNVVTSCMCTTAQLSLGEITSPLFGMHGKSDYILSVPPAATAQLKVIFDPAFHGPSGVGPITRQIKVETNDPEMRELNFTLTAVVRR